ncbi:hypothetical protein [Streptosporangium sp. NPDC049644]|uniref:hypothetical protein n=1 Tax=Streptosporangium sp. NPDC049644 TaxID=3155507 RepID=UPI00343088C5
MLDGPDAAHTVSLPQPGEPLRAIPQTYTEQHSAEYQAQAVIDLAHRLRDKIGPLAVEKIVLHTSLTLQAVKAIGRADAFLVLDKSEAKHDLIRLGQGMIETHAREPYRLAGTCDPERAGPPRLRRSRRGVADTTLGRKSAGPASRFPVRRDAFFGAHHGKLLDERGFPRSDQARRGESVQGEDVGHRCEAGTTGLNPGGDILGGIGVVDQAEPYRPPARGASGG